MYAPFKRLFRVMTHVPQGISLGAAVALTLADQHDRDVGFTYNRKEAKDHGEGGHLVGAALEVILFLAVLLLACGLKGGVRLFA